jgi:nucleotide-binding universal stress UspA family protein
VKTILAPIDFSPVSESVVREAISLARAQEGRVVLLNAIQVSPALNEYAPVLENLTEITAAGERNAARQLAQLAGELTAQGVVVETQQFTGAPIQQILEQADKLQADYIVMGSHGHTALYDLLVGSTTHGVLMRAKCPVVIVPTGKAAARKAAKNRELVAH